MNITSLAINVIGLAFHSWLVFTLYQMYLAAWNKGNAREAWVTIFNTPLGLLIQPFFKWLILVVFAAGSFTLILFFINALMKFTLAVMGNTVAS